jgi:hypothetical protein
LGARGVARGRAGQDHRPFPGTAAEGPLKCGSAGSAAPAVAAGRPPRIRCRADASRGAPDESAPAREPVAIDDDRRRPAVLGRRAPRSGPAGRRQARCRARRRA